MSSRSGPRFWDNDMHQKLRIEGVNRIRHRCKTAGKPGIAIFPVRAYVDEASGVLPATELSAFSCCSRARRSRAWLRSIIREDQMATS